MLFSKTCEYALQAMIFLAVKNKKTVINEISSSIQLPTYYLSKILQNLVRAKLLKSTKGPNGGYELNDKTQNITLAHIIQVIDGLESLRSCGLGYAHCTDANPCPIQNEYNNFQESVLKMLSNKTLEDISNHYKDGKIVIV